MQDKYYVYIPKKPQKSLDKIPQPWHKRIFIALKMLETNLYLGEKMHGDMSNERKIVIWPYRIIYRVNEQKSAVEVLEINHRGNTSYD